MGMETLPTFASAWDRTVHPKDQGFPLHGSLLGGAECLIRTRGISWLIYMLIRSVAGCLLVLPPSFFLLEFFPQDLDVAQGRLTCDGM